MALSERFFSLIQTSRRNPDNHYILRQLVKQNPELVNQLHKGQHPLSLAVSLSGSRSTEETVEILIEAGANINYQDSTGHTLLMIAVQSTRFVLTHSARTTFSSERTVEILLKAGANVHLKTHTGETALMMAIRYVRSYASERVVEMLLNAGSDLNDIPPMGMTVFTAVTQDPTIRVLHLLMARNINPFLRGEDLEQHTRMPFVDGCPKYYLMVKRYLSYYLIFQHVCVPVDIRNIIFDLVFDPSQYVE